MKLQTKIFAGALMLLDVTMAIADPASAQVATPNGNIQPTKTKVTDIVRGEGVITNSSGNLFHGHYRLALSSASGDNSNQLYTVKRGQFIISDKDTRMTFKVDASTWSFTETSNGYTASGNVTDEHGKTFKVALDALMVSKFNNGSIYDANGTFTDASGNQAFQLHYVSVMQEKVPKTTASSSTSS
jgi:hypothetical protein